MANIENRNRSIVGLYTANNAFTAPEGALEIADDIVVQDTDVIEPRRGFKRDTSLGVQVDGVETTRKFFEFNNNETYYAGTTASSTLNFWGPKGSINYGVGAAPSTAEFLQDESNTVFIGTGITGVITATQEPNLSDGTKRRINAQEQNRRLYYTTSKGVHKLFFEKGSEEMEFRLAGQEPVSQVELALAGTGDPVGETNFFTFSNTNISTIAYRVCTEVNDKLGRPSPRAIYTSSQLPEVVSATRSTTTGTITTASAHGLSTNDFITIDDSASGDWEGTYQISVSSPTVFTITLAGTETTPETISEWSYKRHFTVTWNQPKVNDTGDGLDTTIRFGTAPTGSSTIGDFSGHTYRVHRTRVTTVTTAVGATDPGDEMLRVGDIANTYTENAGDKTESFTDTILEANLGIPLYTNPSQNSFAKANSVPPQAASMASFQGHMFYGNCTPQPALRLKLSDLSEISNGDTFLLDGITFTAAASENIAAEGFLLATGGTAIENLKNTVISICRAINGSTTCNVEAGYNSSFNEDPGFFTLRAINSRTAVSPSSSNMQNSTTPALSSIEAKEPVDRKPERLYFSRFEQPDAVPDLDFFEIDEQGEIISLVATDNRLLVFTDVGLFELTGTTEPFTLRRIDTGVRLVAPDSVEVLRNSVYGLTDVGVVRISGSNVQVISQQIDDLVTLARTRTNFRTLCHAGVNRKHREYSIWLPTDNVSTLKGYTFNDKTAAWTTNSINTQAAYSNRVSTEYYLGAPTIDKAYETSTFPETAFYNAPYVERLTGTLDDYYNREYQVTLREINSNVVKIYLGSITEDGVIVAPQVDWALKQGTETRIVTAVTSTSETIGALTVLIYELTLDEAPTEWAVAGGNYFDYDMTLYENNPTTVRWTPFFGGSLALNKQFQEVHVIPDACTISEATITTISDIDGIAVDTVFDTNCDGNEWGDGEFGSGHWGGDNALIGQPLRVTIPGEQQSARHMRVTLSHTKPGEFYEIVGVAMLFEPNSANTTT